jgi:hypothetical protein
MTKSDIEFPLRIVLDTPPVGVMFALQRGKAELVSQTIATGDDLQFEFVVRAGGREEEWPNFLGPFVQGPRGGRFIYVNSGTSAGQANSCWTRRAKIALKGIGWDLIDRALAAPGRVLEARIAGRGRDGGPACATVPLLGERWKII